jgi:group II intron reverse transcriptase/maturase
VQFSRDKLLEAILSPSNLNRAYKQVVGNKGSGGVDNMNTEELLPYLLRHKDDLISSLYTGRYRPNPVRRVEIPKDNGKTRQLGIPTVVDRFIQQAISQVLTKLYDADFSPSSYGFRPGRNCHQALERAQNIINEGYHYAVDIDLEKFFDTVNQSKLIEVLSRKIKDGRVISLIHKYLRAGVAIGACHEESHSGVPQGSPLSPLLGNIMLDELDKELERRGHPFVRYADDGLLVLCTLALCEARAKYEYELLQRCFAVVVALAVAPASQGFNSRSHLFNTLGMDAETAFAVATIKGVTQKFNPENLTEIRLFLVYFVLRTKYKYTKV